MILQRIGWPDRIEDRELFYRTDGTIELDPKAAAFHLHGNAVRFDTYFNAFSLIKWRKYTLLEGVALTLELKGDAEVALLRHDLRGELEARPARLEQPEFDAVETVVRTERFHFDDFTPVTLDYPDIDGATGLSFSVRPLSGGAAFRRAAYRTPVDAPEPAPAKLALAICTYKREGYVGASMDALRKGVFNDPDSPIREHLRVYIADNGQSLDARQFADLPVSVYPNKNSGGSGGFSRAAIEAMHDDRFPATHVVLMDDDISFNVWALERNHSFVSLIRPEYALSLLGGTMLNADKRHLLYAAGERFTLHGIKNDKEEWDLRDIRYVLLEETDIPVDYFGWWYCCIPVPLLKRKQFSMPFFVQFDDVEFSLRCPESEKICLNGVCCWHDSLEHKENDTRYYYNYRNLTIMGLLYYPEFDGGHLKRMLKEDIMHMLFCYEYKRTHLALRGIEDFLKGVDWLAGQDPAALHREMLAAADPILPAEKLPVAFDPKDVLRNSDIDQNPLKRRLRWLLLNGWLLPAKRRAVVVEKFRSPMQYYFRAGTVVKYDLDTHLGLVSRRSYREALSVIRHLRRTLKAVDERFDQAAAEFRARHDEITSEAFWRKYLGF